MPPLKYAPPALWTPLARSHQPYALAENETQNDQLEMLNWTDPSISCDPSDRPHETHDAASVRSGTTPLVKQHNHHNSTLSLTARRLKSRWQRLHGYRFGTVLCAGVTGTTFGVNLALTIWASKNFGVSGGVGTIQSGNCQQTKTLSIWLHLVINVLSTALLSASNYCMQCLSSPTRQDIDKAHAQNKWLDIGVPSVRNLRRISWKRIILWWLLAISSLPLHLMYNSVVFDTLSAFDEYNVYVVSKDFLSGAPYTLDPYTRDELPSRLDSLRESNSNNTLKRITLDRKRCILTYGNGFLSKYGDVLAVSTTRNATNSLLDSYRERPFQGYLDGKRSWLCSSNDHILFSCNIEDLANNAQDWIVSGYPIDHCISQEVDEKCALHFSLPIMLVVIICNLIKTTCMILMVLKEGSQPLVTVGDAIASFLVEPDPATKNLCLADKYFFREESWQARRLMWTPERHRWFEAASGVRWLVCNVLCITTLVLAGVLLGIGLNDDSFTDKSISNLWKMGYGTVSGDSLITGIPIPEGSAGIMASVLLANAPQAILSFLYLTYNGLFSCMLLMEEWTGFAHERKPLRVTSPVGMQRSSYWLQLPYTYGIPLLVMSGTLHWLVSQSIFLARVTVSDHWGDEDQGESISTCGYSCIAIITVIFLGSIVLFLGILNGFRKYKEGMPLIGSCSAAISAACHAMRKDSDAASLPVLWGAVEKEGTVGHCCFSSFDVSPPVDGEQYAGEEEEIENNSDPPPHGKQKQPVRRIPRRRRKN